MNSGGAGNMPHSLHEFLFFGPNGSLTPTGDLVIESRQWRDQLFAQRASRSRRGRPSCSGSRGR